MVFVSGIIVGVVLSFLALRLYRAWDRFSEEKVEPYAAQVNPKDDVVFNKRPRPNLVALPAVRPIVRQAKVVSTGRDKSEA